MRSKRLWQVSIAVVCAAPLLLAAPPRGDVAWLDEVRQPPAALPETKIELAPLLVDTDGQAIRTVPEWEQRRAVLRREWLEFLGPLAAAHLAAAGTTPQPAAPPKWTVVETEEIDGLTRQLIRYYVEDQQTVDAFLLIPTAAKAAAGVVVFHSTVAESLRQPAGIEGAPEKAFGLKLARRGYVTLCPRNYLWPESHRIDARGEAERFLKRQPQSKGMDRMLLDALIAVDILASLPQVDPQRIGCVGHSLGAKEALYLAAFDDRVRVTVSSEGGIGTMHSNWHDAWYLGEAIRSPDFRHEHHELLALAAPRPFLLIGGDSADGDQSWPWIAAALDVYRLYGPDPRLGLLNHKQGHSVPPLAEQRTMEWFNAYL